MFLFLFFRSALTVLIFLFCFVLTSSLRESPEGSTLHRDPGGSSHSNMDI
jgi:hypothetical protein